jgi:hypothetical protein
MLALEDTGWAELKTAYGSARDIPDYLRAIRENPFAGLQHDDGSFAPFTGPWNALWSSLMHQGDVYSASFAAVPHLLQIGRFVAESSPSQFDWQFIGLPVSIDIAGGKNRAKFGAENSHPLQISTIIEFVKLLEHVSWSQELSRSIAAGLLRAQGCTKHAELIISREESEIDELF